MSDLHLGQDKAAVLELHQAIVVWILAVFPEFGSINLGITILVGKSIQKTSQ